MPKKIPDCAYCGVSLRGKGCGATVMLHYQDGDGGPMIGWHRKCIEADEDLFDVAQAGIYGGDSQSAPEDDHMPWAIKVVAFRGRSRVSAGARFWRRAFNECLQWIEELRAGGEMLPENE